MFEDILFYIQSNITYAPWVIFGLLLLAGLNLPVSEDLMLFTSALLAAKNPDHLVPLFLGVYCGAYLSDLIAYGLGRYLGPALWRFRFFARSISFERVSTLKHFYDQYGPLTLICGRFIPFGVRNALFMTAGLGKMNFIKFALSDLLAATLSCTGFFALYYHYGESVVEWVKKGNIILFSTATILVIAWVAKKHLAKRKS